MKKSKNDDKIIYQLIGIMIALISVVLWHFDLLIPGTIVFILLFLFWIFYHDVLYGPVALVFYLSATTEIIYFKNPYLGWTLVLLGFGTVLGRRALSGGD
ncbi:MAG: hypothetical protein Q8N99_06650 [Nanoarchaeota archaeon]|nr:hypothetical protein [Nanoarchaeota archaeon]